MTDPPSPSRVGTVVAGKYRLDEELGRGGMGAVYRAYHLRVHKDFAIKVLLSEVVEHRSIASRFFLEAQAAGRIGHPGILDVYDVGEDADGTPYIVMELLRGEALATLVRRERVDVDAACFIAMEVLDVLEAAHRSGIIHRDVKPQNVFITEKSGAASDVGGSGAGASPSAPPKSTDPTPVPVSGVTRGVKLLDFGVAKFAGASGDISALTRSGEIIGSPLYMAPEQAKGELDLDARADLWSVGAMLFEMLTGRCAHAATTPVAVLAKILTEQAPAPSTRDDRVPPELDVVVEKALRIDRTQRFASAQEMRDALHEVRKKRGTADKAPIIPPAVKRSVPPAPTDRTPGAITSTVAAPSDPPPQRPWSSRPRPRDLKEGAEGPSAVGPHTPPETNVSPAVMRSRVIFGAGAGIAAVALVSWYLVAHSSSPNITASEVVANSGPQASASSAVSATASALLEPSTSTSTSSSAAPFESATPAASSSSKATTTTTTTAPPTIAAPKCAAGEILSKGHCCARGLEWQNGHCERPLATTF